MAKNIKSRHVDRKRPVREYRCDGCDLVKKLRPGRHWHTCEGVQWEMMDVRLSAVVEAAVGAAMAHLAQDR